MPKINRLFIGFFLAVWGSSISMLCAEASSPATASSKNVVSSASEAGTQEEVRDPFAMVLPSAPAAAAPTSAAPEIKAELQGIGFGSKDAYAVIGGDVFYIGDDKNGIKLLEVRKGEVDILVNGGKTTLPLFPSQELKKAREREKAKKKSAMENTSEGQPSEKPSSLSGREQPPL